MVPGLAHRSVRVGSGQNAELWSGERPDLPVADIAVARDFYTDYLGLSVEEFNMGWVARYSSPGGEASVQFVTGDATAPQNSVVSVHVGAGVEEAYAEAQRRGTRSSTRSPRSRGAWRRFFVRAPDGNVINMVSHSDE